MDSDQLASTNLDLHCFHKRSSHAVNMYADYNSVFQPVQSFDPIYCYRFNGGMESRVELDQI